MLAHNVPVETVVADATHLNKSTKRDPAAQRDALKIPAAELSEKLRGDRRYIVLKREVPEADGRQRCAINCAQKICAASISSAIRTRIYPNGSMLCHVIGFTDFEHHGIQGVEAVDGRISAWRRMVTATSSTTAPGQEIVLYRGQERAPRDGYQVHLTVDLNLQNIVENEIDAAMQRIFTRKRRRSF